MFSRIYYLLQSMARRNEGNIAILTALSMTVVVGVVALTIDMSKGINSKSRLGDTTDALALFWQSPESRHNQAWSRLRKSF